MSGKKILVVDDEPEILKNLKTVLQKIREVEVASSGSEALKIVERDKPALVILDFNLPGGPDGFETIKSIRAIDEKIPVIILSARFEDAVVIEMFKAGAKDFIRKPYITKELMARVKIQLENYDIAHTDDLTGLRNMRHVYADIDQTIKKGDPIAVIMMDMDHFKQVNDNHDHLFGSFVLRETGEMMHKFLDEQMPGRYLASRFGGDEFLWCIIPDDLDHAKKLLNSMRKMIEEHLYKNGDDEISLTISSGIAYYGNSRENTIQLNSQALLRIADQALYESKEQGRNQVTSYDDVNNPDVFKKFSDAKEIKRYTL